MRQGRCLNIGYDLGILTPNVFTMSVLMTFVTIAP